MSRQEEFLRKLAKYLKDNKPDLFQKLDNMIKNEDPRAFDILEHCYYMYLWFDFDKAMETLTRELEEVKEVTKK